jgi:hypothetical protein
LEGSIAATTITNIFYIIRKTEGREVALAAINRLLIGSRKVTTISWASAS